MIQNSIYRWLLSFMSGAVITLFLFWFMQFMINSDETKPEESSVYKLIEFVNTKQDVTPPELVKELPPEPEKEEEPPKVPNEITESQSVSEVQDIAPINMDVPKLSGDFKLSGGAPKILAPQRVEDVDMPLTPMINIKPVYPSRQKRMGVEGYVKVELDVDATGSVISIKILDSQPNGVFDKSVKKALRKWKFRPKTVNGKAVNQKGELTLNFKLGND